MTGTLAPRSTTGWRRHRSTLLIVSGFVLAVMVAVALGIGDDGQTGRYDPDNSGPDGAQALARVLDDEGVEVSVARSADQLDDTTIGADTVVVVTSTDKLGANTIDRLLQRTRDSRLVLIDPSSDIVAAAGFAVETARVDPRERLSANCDNPMFDGLSLEVDSAFSYGDSGCFEQKSAAILVERDDVTLFGGGAAMTNDQVLRGDNAAVSLRLLGQGGNLVWYVPRFEDVGADDGLGVTSLLPRWIQPGLWMVAIALIFLTVWRARRLGPLSTEPLPVVVDAIETTRSRGRLYRKSQDRAHTSAALRTAARARVATRLGLAVGHDEHALVRDLARQIGRSEAEIAALVGADAEPPESDRDLITLARRLTELDREARPT